MANATDVSNLIAKNMGEFFVQQNPIYNTGNKKYVEQCTQQMYATGGRIGIKIPGAPPVQRGMTNTPSGLSDLVIPYTITEDDIYSVTRELNAYEEIFDIIGKGSALTKFNREAIVDNYAYPAYQAIAGEIENTAAYEFKTTAYMTPIDEVAKLGSVSTYSAISSLGVMCDVMKLGYTERYLMMNPYDATQVENSLQNMFNQAINTKITLNSRIGSHEKGRLAGFDLMRSTEFRKHVAGTLAGLSGITVGSISTDGTTLVLNGVPSLTSVLVKAGDRISIPSVYLVDPILHRPVSYKLVVTAAADALGTGSGTVAVTLSHPLIVAGDHQNVQAMPAPGAAVAVFPDRNINYAYVPSGLSVTPLRLPQVRGADNSTNSGDLKVPVNVYIQGLVNDLNNVFRISALVGILVLAPYVIELPSIA